MPQLGPRTEKRDTFTRLLGPPLKGTVKECMLKEVKNPRTHTPELASAAAERRAAERWTLGEAAAELSEQSSGVMSPDDWITILEELVPAEVRHPPGGEMQADDVNALLQAHPTWRSIGTPRLPSARQTNEHMLGHLDYSMHAADWFGMAAVTPREAASLLCQSDPLYDKADPENHTNDETGPEDFKLLLRVFSDVERSDPKDRTLIEWFTIAEARRCKHHSWIGRYLDARQRLGFPVVPTQAAPVVTAGAPGGVVPAKAGPGWSLKASIVRAPGYRWPLYQTLKAAHVAGQPCPKARDVLDAWAKKPPLDVQVMSDGVKYNDGLGNPKEANLKAIQQAIKGLLKQ